LLTEEITFRVELRRAEILDVRDVLRRVVTEPLAAVSMKILNPEMY
jgi:hypothetical protein